MLKDVNLKVYMDSQLKVFNRTAYEQFLAKNKNPSNSGISFIDVDGLGVMNNMYGYDAGDRMLDVVVSCFKNNFRFNDIYRICGDEFVIICNKSEKEHFIKKINDSLHLIAETPFTVSIASTYSDYSC